MSENIYNFPSDLDPIKEKNSLQWGHKVGSAIYNEWFRNNTYYKRQEWIRQMRNYARGNHDMGQYKDWLCGDLIKENPTLSKYFSSIDFKRRSKVFPKMIDVIINNITEVEFSPIAYALDPTNQEIKKEKKIKKKTLIYAKDFIKEANEKLGTNIQGVDEEETIESVEVNDLLNGKEAIEKAEEVLIGAVFKDSKIDNKRHRWSRDAVEIGIQVAYRGIDKAKGIHIDYVDPEYFIHKYNKNDPYFEESTYFGELRKISVGDLKRLSDVHLPDETIEGFVKNGARGTVKTSIFDDDNNQVEVLRFVYKTSHTKIYKERTKNKHGNLRLVDKTDTGYSPSTPDAKPPIHDTYDVWYEGVAVLPGESIDSAVNMVMVKWELMENMTKDDCSQEILPPFIVVSPNIQDNKLDSIVDRAISPFMNMQKLDLKIQQLQSELKPNIKNVPKSFFEGIDFGNGQKITPSELAAMWRSQSVMIYEDTDDQGMPSQNGKRIEQSPANASGDLERAMNTFRFWENITRECLGLNEATDSVSPHPDTLVKVQEIARLNSNKAIRHILNAHINLLHNLALGVSHSFSLLWTWSDKLKNIYINKIGLDDVEVKQKLNGRQSSYFGIYIDYIPDQTDLLNFQQDLQIALQQGAITPDDLITIRRVKNIRLAELLLRVRTKENLKNRTKEADQTAQRNLNVNVQSAVAKQEEERKTLQMKYDLEAKQRELEAYYDYQKIRTQSEAQIAIDNNDFSGRRELALISINQQMNKLEYAKDKDRENRLNVVERQAELKSQLKDQDKYGTIPEFRRFGE